MKTVSDSRAAEELERAVLSIERKARQIRRDGNAYDADVAWGMETAAAMLRARARRLRKGKR